MNPAPSMVPGESPGRVMDAPSETDGAGFFLPIETTDAHAKRVFGPMLDAGTAGFFSYGSGAVWILERENALEIHLDAPHDALRLWPHFVEWLRARYEQRRVLSYCASSNRPARLAMIRAGFNVLGVSGNQIVFAIDL